MVTLIEFICSLKPSGCKIYTFYPSTCAFSFQVFKCNMTPHDRNFFTMQTDREKKEGKLTFDRIPAFADHLYYFFCFISFVAFNANETA